MQEEQKLASAATPPAATAAPRAPRAATAAPAAITLTAPAPAASRAASAPATAPAAAPPPFRGPLVLLYVQVATNGRCLGGLLHRIARLQVFEHHHDQRRWPVRAFQVCTDFPQIAIRVAPALQYLGKLACRRRVQLVLFGNLFNLGVRSPRSTEHALCHPTNTDHEQVGWIFSTLQDFIHGCDVILEGVVALLELLIEQTCVAVCQVEVMLKLEHFCL
mmetsp:Transcript_15567/g.36401  ORF Transcript_15567/g.36401 Transcript_15567/m.36401 type:complete len:219 (+) Transcript_15567:88-744(+)